MGANNNITPEALKDLMKYLEKNKGIIKYQYGGQDPYNTLSQGVQGLDQGINIPQNPYTGAFNIPPMGNFGNGNMQQGQNDWSNNDPIYEELSKKDPRELTRSETQYLNDRAQSYGPAGQNGLQGTLPQGNTGGYGPDDIWKAYGRGEIDIDTANRLETTIGGDGKTTTGATPSNGYVNEKGQLVGGSSDGSKYEKNEHGQFVNAMKDYSGLNFTGGFDMNSTAYNLGRFVGAPKGTKGKVAGTVAAGLALALKGARGVAAGMGHANLAKEAQQWEMQQMAKRKFTPDSQWEDNNYMGGNTHKYGGVHENYQYGGERNEADQSFIRYATLTPEEKIKAINSYEEFTGRAVNKDTFNITENQLESFRKGEPVKGYWGEGNKPYVEQNAHFIIPERGAKPIWVSRNEYENFKGPKSTAALDESGQPLIGATGGRRMDPNSYQDMRDKQLGNFSRGNIIQEEGKPKKLNTLDLNGMVFQDGGEQQEQMQEQQGDQMQQIMQMADQMFQQGAQPVEVASQLIQQGVPAEAIPQIFGQLGIPEEDIQAVMQQLMQAQSPQQKYGGLFEYGGSKEQDSNSMYRVGEPLEFEYGGKMVKGTVKKVENGKIYI